MTMGKRNFMGRPFAAGAAKKSKTGAKCMK
jgi:hypothetical protein